jgi:hypothetical protein
MWLQEETGRQSLENRVFWSLRSDLLPVKAWHALPGWAQYYQALHSQIPPTLYPQPVRGTFPPSVSWQ